MVSTDAPATRVDYDLAAADYARHRGVHPGVVRALVETGTIGPETRILDVGCGTGNYARALVALTGCRMSGIEPSVEMIGRAREAATWGTLVQGTAEQLPFPNDSVDLVMSTDVIHHVGDRDAFFREAARVLRPGGLIATVTDSHDDLARRRPLTSHFPETLAIELQRYPEIEVLGTEMARAGFTTIHSASVEHDYDLADAQPYRDRAFSSLLLIDDDAFARGVARLDADLRRGPVPCRSLYSILWGHKPHA